MCVYTNSDMTEFEDLLALAEAGDAKAQFSLAETYHNGNGVPQDMGQAVVWYTQAALQEYPDALNYLRQAAKNEAEGARLHLEAVKGDGKAKFALALAFKEGRGVRQSDAEAYRWYRLAVEQDSSLAQLLDRADAKDWKQRLEDEAAIDGDADKQVALGRRYANGEGVAQDDAEAFRWYQLAAEQGHFGAQVDLARSYLEGFGVSQDYELAHIWANRAVGHAPRDSREAAITLRDQAETHFSSSEILALQRRARAELASSGLERPVSNTPKPVTDPAPASSNPNQGLSTPSVTTSGAPIGERAAGDVSVVDPGVHRPAERAKVSPLVIAVVIGGIAVMLWMFRYEYEATVLNLPNVPSVSYQIRTDRWTGETCYVYPPGRLSAIPAMLLGQSCGATQ